ncbi:DHS-like NAD/FAD-binding domain-containing protein [Myxozyma melibiosi]|uniref:DHS-like NAD/FAD-binding domain-containing protein n=1 Tax=Myxozyma melibiosi TaxID=54550 RepID=A0ABR1FAN9_9ASCO
MAPASPLQQLSQQPTTISVRLADAKSDCEVERLVCGIASRVSKARRILFVTGAGISCNAGIPDFRSENGLYNLVKKEYPNAVVKGKDLFDSILFSDPISTSVFCTFMVRLRSCILGARSTSVHKFIKLLHDKKKLLRCYTQNIDGLESRENLQIGVEGKQSTVVQLHGNIHMLKCTLCCKEFEWSEEDCDLLEEGFIPECQNCTEKAEERTSLGKRCPRVGVLRPNIVLYGEEHPDGENIGRCIESDLKARPDMLIIAGTSLKVIGIKKLVRSAAKAVHERGGVVVYVNRTLPAARSWKGQIDYHIDSDCDEWVEDLHRRQPGLFLKQTELPVTPSKKVVVKKENLKRKHEEEGAAEAEPLNDITNLTTTMSTPEKRKKIASTVRSVFGVKEKVRPAGKLEVLKDRAEGMESVRAISVHAT